MNPHPNLTTEVIRGLGWIYLLLCAMNALWAWREGKRGAGLGTVVGWVAYATMLFLIGMAHVTGGAGPESFPFRMPQAIKTQIDGLANPVVYFIGSIVVFAAVIRWRESLVKP